MFSSMLSRIKDLPLAIYVTLTTFAFILMDEIKAEAATDKKLDALATGLIKEFKVYITFILWVAILVGVILFFMGIIKMTKRSGGDEGPAKGIIFMVAGAMLVGLATIIGMMSNSLTLGGTDETSTGVSRIKFGSEGESGGN